MHLLSGTLRTAKHNNALLAKRSRQLANPLKESVTHHLENIALRTVPLIPILCMIYGGIIFSYLLSLVPCERPPAAATPV